MKKFKYKGRDVMTFSLNNEGSATDYILIPESSYDLPSENNHIQTLIGKGFLEEVTEVKTTKNVK